MTAKTGELTGRKVLAIALTAFAVIVAANMAMLFAATGSFPGLVVKNSYVASQGWNDRARAQRATGWRVSTGYEAGVLSIVVDGAGGAPVKGLAVAATVGRPASDAEDRQLNLVERDGRYTAALDLDPGAWRVEIRADGRDAGVYRATGAVFVRGGGAK